ncbi:MAG: glycosyltransferase family 2 protein [Actinobacteria bacterium]|nr:glycosyltransferase family 2 protein [Actinomycetota bacterium]
MNQIKSKNLPSISIVIPTYNCGNFLNLCLDSIVSQDYPVELIEIIIIDGGSTDNTIEIAKKYTNKIFNNPLRTGEAGKAIGVKNAKNELIALIDSDNILPDKNWFIQMVQPFIEDNNIIGSEPLEYTYRKTDSYITRYCALTGMNDILCLFIGNYDRYCYLTEKWTDMEVSFEDKENYLILNFNYKNIKQIPTIGANGTIFRKSFFQNLNIGDYLFDIDLIALKIYCMKDDIYFAKIRNGIIHLFSGNIFTYIRKQKRRIRDYKKYKKLRKYEWLKINNRGIIKFILYSLLILPLFFQSARGYFKKRDLAWFFHPVASFITLFIYCLGFINIKRNIFKI